VYLDTNPEALTTGASSQFFNRVNHEFDGHKVWYLLDRGSDWMGTGWESKIEGRGVFCACRRADGAGGNCKMPIHIGLCPDVLVLSGAI
jgi:hypothetical protein